MSRQITLYTRRECCLCEEMKSILREVAERYPLTIEEVDVDSSPELQERYGNEVPVLFINGRKAFKYRVTAKELEHKLRGSAS
ncbi:MAG TPA: glutaredoxin family protein [Candidatus Binatia bacterium]|nr:glutaredoxin family protein [Candidatus Binatia bacterium]